MKIEIDLQNIIDLCENSEGALGAHSFLLAQIEPPFFEQLLKHTNSNQSRAARIAGLHRGTLTARLKQYRLVINKEVTIK